MGTKSRKSVSYDTRRMVADMTRRGWEGKDLAAAAGVSKMTVSRFLRREVQTVKTAKRLSAALRRSPGYYLVLSRAVERRSRPIDERIAS